MIRIREHPDAVGFEVSGTLSGDDYDRLIPEIERHRADRRGRGEAMGEWATRLSRPFLKADMRFFRPEEAEQARRWVAEARQPG